MAEIIGYGEDAMTLSAIICEKQIIKFLNNMGVRNPQSIKRQLKTAVYFYRPSSGRGKKGYGEFDAIISTDKKIYFIESKWQKSSEVKKSKPIELREEQIDRHKIFTEIIRMNLDKPNMSLENILKEINAKNKKNIKKIIGSRLYNNLNYILPKLLKNKYKIKDKDIVRNVILIFVTDGEKIITKERRYKPTEDIEFNVKTIKYTPEETPGFIKIKF